jgi:hypothetical protein
MRPLKRAQGEKPLRFFPLTSFPTKSFEQEGTSLGGGRYFSLPRIVASFFGWVCDQTSMNSNKQTATHADGLLMTARKAVVVGGFEKPAKAVLTGRPEHEVTGHLTGY